MAEKKSRSVAEQLKRAIKDSGLSYNQLAQRTGVDHTRLSRFMRDERDLTLDAVDRLCRALGLELAATSMPEAGTASEGTERRKAKGE